MFFIKLMNQKTKTNKQKAQPTNFTQHQNVFHLSLKCKNVQLNNIASLFIISPVSTWMISHVTKNEHSAAWYGKNNH